MLIAKLEGNRVEGWGWRVEGGGGVEKSVKMGEREKTWVCLWPCLCLCCAAWRQGSCCLFCMYMKEITVSWLSLLFAPFPNNLKLCFTILSIKLWEETRLSMPSSLLWDTAYPDYKWEYYISYLDIPVSWTLCISSTTWQSYWCWSGMYP